jgi:hypothetical protein
MCLEGAASSPVFHNERQSSLTNNGKVNRTDTLGCVACVPEREYHFLGRLQKHQLSSVFNSHVEITKDDEGQPVSPQCLDGVH